MNDLIKTLSDVFAYKKKSSLDWILPASVGVGLGVVCGVGIGLLIAKEPGEETRRRLRDRAERVKERAISTVQAAQERLQGQSRQASESGVFAQDTGGIVR